MSTEQEPLISLKEAGRLLGMDLHAVQRLTKKKTGVRLESVKVSPRRFATRLSWVQAYLAQLNPPAAELLRVDSRKAAQIDRRLAAKGYFGATKKREVLGVSKARGHTRALPSVRSGQATTPTLRGNRSGEGTKSPEVLDA